MGMSKFLMQIENLKEVQFFIASSGIYGSYLYYGLIQEHIFKTNFAQAGESPSPLFAYSFALILFQMFFTCIVSKSMCVIKKQEDVCTFWEAFKLGFYNFGSMFGSNTALRMVSYPLQALTKSCKILSIILVGLVFGGINFTKQQVFCGSLITLGIFIFNFFESSGKSDKSSSFFGLLILVVSLFCDGMLASVQQQLKTTKKIGQWEMMKHISLIVQGFLLSLIYAVISMEIFGFLEYITKYPAIVKNLVVLSLLGVVGQIFIFYCIRILSIITTTRKFFTVLASIFIYGHQVSSTQWSAILLVAIGVGLELAQGLKSHKTKS